MGQVEIFFFWGGNLSQKMNRFEKNQTSSRVKPRVMMVPVVMVALMMIGTTKDDGHRTRIPINEHFTIPYDGEKHSCLWSGSAVKSG